MSEHRGSRSAPGLKLDPTSFRFVLMYVLAIGLVVIAVNLVQAIMATNHSDRAEATMDYWSGLKFERLPLADGIQKEEERLRKAISMAPDNPIHHDRLSQLYLWELATQETDNAGRQKLFDQGLTEARKSIALLPGWASSWVRMLVWKSATNELDAEFDAALERATTLGKWQALINHTVLTTALPRWDTLSTVERSRVLEAGKRGLLQSSSSTLPILEEYGRLEDVCQILDADEQAERNDCKNTQ